jgi:signal transduction histidine kinase
MKQDTVPAATAFSTRHPEQLRVAQAVAVVRQLPLTIATIFGGMAMALLMQLEGGRFGLGALLWQLAMASMAAGGIGRWRRLRHRPPPAVVSRGHIRKLTALTAFHGLLTAIGTIAWSTSAGPDVGTWILGIMLALPAYAAAAFYFIPGVVAAFSAPVFAACLFVVGRDWGERSGELGLLLISFHILVTTYFVRRNWEHFAHMVDLDVEKTKLAEELREQARQLLHAQSRLLAEARRAGMAQIATNVLHNVGNVLTSVNVAAHVVADRVRDTRAVRVADIASLLEKLLATESSSPEDQERMRMLPGYVRELATALSTEREELLAELQRLGASVEHIKNVVAMQQSYAGASGIVEHARVTQLVDDALRLQEDALARGGVVVTRNYCDPRPMSLDRTRTMQILVNLIENARHAMENAHGERRLAVAVRDGGEWIDVDVADGGCGIAREHLAKIFSHGFTTKPQGHGFGLHSCALAAREMGGELSVHSDGPGAGATFTLRLPVNATSVAPSTTPACSR